MATGNPNDLRQGPGRVDPMTDTAWGCGWAWLWFWLFLIVIFFGAWGWGGWYRGWGGPWGWWGPRQGAPQVQNGQQAPQAPKVEHVAVAMGVFQGRTVTLTGKVDHVYSPQTFTLAPAAGGKDLLVINEHQKPLKIGDTVEVTGKVEKYEEATLHKQTGVELNKVPATEFKDKPAVVASEVAVKSSTARSGGGT